MVFIKNGAVPLALMEGIFYKILELKKKNAIFALPCNPKSK